MSFKPNLEVGGFEHIDFKRLKEKGFLGLILDVDSTLTYHKGKFIPEKVKEKLEEAKRNGFKISIISNCKWRRKKEVKEMFKDYTDLVFNFPWKPFKRAFKKVEKETGISLEKQVMIGDRYLMDVFAGNRAGCYTIKVGDKLFSKDSLYIKAMRFFENILYRIFG